MRGTEVPGRESAPQRQRSPRRSSPVSFVAMAMATWSCNGASSRCYSTASSRRCSTASSQSYNAAARVAVALRRCCSTCRGSVTALLQHASRQHCYNSRCCGNSRRSDTVAASAALAHVAATLRRCCSSQQRRKAASGSSARSNGRQGYAALQRWQGASAEIFLFIYLFIFYSTVSKREREQDREKRDRASKPVSRLCWLA